MPTIETRNIIQDARDQLVGKVPLPIDQCNEITRALIYKFLRATDTESIEDGGQPTYFAGDHAEFHWDRLMASEQTALEISRRYTAGLAMLGGRQDIPAVFRAFYQNAVVPYDDEVVLRGFLNIIDRFDTGDTETIGDAYETMLQYLGAQASAGQFRTPRHIIDFIVAIVDPQQRESILDPACGTGGFLASAWQHINRAGDLTAADRSRLAGSIVGYDISPDMVRLASINLYLSHGQDPDVSVYDTLTHEDRWNDHYDVILANPPFMSPKGGIRPHQRYSISSRRSEVLFVDYIMGHLNERGRAGVIVPEGVIFQQQRGHTELRRLLVENCLVAVISLPGGVFQPYSGVKTSILIMDKELGRKTDRIAFFKVENDGYDLGAQRRPIAANDLPTVQAEIAEYRRRLRAGEPVNDFEPTLGLVVAKDKIARGGEYNLSGARYREGDRQNSQFPIVALGDIASVTAGQSPPGKSYNDMGDGTPFYQGKTEFGRTFIGKPIKWTSSPLRFAYDGDILMSVRAPVGPVNLATQRMCIGRGLAAIKPSPESALTSYVFYLLHNMESRITGNDGAAFASINKGDIEKLQIPLPPLEVQREIVAEIEEYQRVIDGARAVVDNWRPRIAIDPEWPVVELGDACEIKRGKFAHRPRNESRFYGGNYPFIQTGDVTRANGGKISYTQTLNDEGLSISRLFQPPVVVITIAANIGDTAVLDFPCCFPDSVIGLIPNDGTDAWFLELIMRSKKQYLNKIAPQAAQKNINVGILKTLEVPLPSLDVQLQIVDEVKAEQAAVDHARDLVARMQGRIDAAIGRVWGG